eukprot:scaffold251124_cov32-Tisochrysis_lutea.AAC.6
MVCHREESRTYRSEQVDTRGASQSPGARAQTRWRPRLREAKRPWCALPGSGAAAGPTGRVGRKRAARAHPRRPQSRHRMSSTLYWGRGPACTAHCGSRAKRGSSRPCKSAAGLGRR